MNEDLQIEAMECFMRPAFSAPEESDAWTEQLVYAGNEPKITGILTLPVPDEEEDSDELPPVAVLMGEEIDDAMNESGSNDLLRADLAHALAENGVASVRFNTRCYEDPKLFELFEREDYSDHIDEIIERSLRVKQGVVERDEREGGERKLLNFGHTYGHAYESYHDLNRYLHGECVAMGMMTVVKEPQLKERLRAVLERLELPLECECDKEEICRLVQSDKKADHGTVTIVQVDELGHGFTEEWDTDRIRKGLGL
jgi:hypothetical protein